MVTLQIIEKAVIYITRADRLLVFRHIDFPEAGIQVPAGTLKPGEDPLAGALREAQEETGLVDLRLKSFLGTRDVDVSPFGRPEIHRRHFYHFELTRLAPEAWIHAEDDPSGCDPGPIFFEFFWVRFPKAVPVLSGGLGDLLDKIQL